jgi:hypothetical protein
MTRRRTIGAVIAGVGGVGGTLFCLQLWLLDGLDGWVFGKTLREDTVYAAGYSDAAFRSVAAGMSEAEVEQVLGAPYSRWTIERSGAGPDAGARWSHSPGDTRYRCRIILFRGGYVVEKHAEFYVD